MPPINTAELASLPLAQRLECMEVLWASLESDANQTNVVPNWHAEIVRQRLEAHNAGEPATPWADAKLRLRAIAESQKTAMRAINGA